MMWKKAILFEDYEIADKVLKVKTPKEAKALGRKVLKITFGSKIELKLCTKETI